MAAIASRNHGHWRRRTMSRGKALIRFGSFCTAMFLYCSVAWRSCEYLPGDIWRSVAATILRA